MVNISLPEESYKRFAALVEEEIYLRRGGSFGKLCRMAGVRENDMDKMLKSEIGLGGKAFVRALRNQKTMFPDKRF